jgi:integrase
VASVHKNGPISAKMGRFSKVLGMARLRTLTIHHGRHTFISHALAGSRSLAEVRNAAGHANVAITSLYLHVAVDDDDGVEDLFRYE